MKYMMLINLIHIILLKEAQMNSNRWIVKWLEAEIEATKNKLNA